ncbi:hypothetical protein TNCV_2118101 [Trichonephila clavipes]|nr:hypothetical protein TNCV_2118101 [Trichonephila clavipes]
MQLLSWPAFLTDMLPMEHMWDLVSRRIDSDPRPAASKDELLQRIKAIRNSVPQEDIQNLTSWRRSKRHMSGTVKQERICTRSEQSRLKEVQEEEGVLCGPGIAD